MALKLKPVSGKGNSFCGPAAISIITGLPVDKCAKAIRLTTNVKYVFGCAWWQMSHTLRNLGYSTTDFQRLSKPTFTQWLKKRDKSLLYIVNITGHYVVVKGNFACDNRSKVPVRVRDFGYRRCRVDGVMEVHSKINKNKLDLSMKPTVHQTAAQKARYQIKKLIAKYPTIKIEVDRVESDLRHIWVTDTRFNEENETDPHHGDHIAIDWSEALAKALIYSQTYTSQSDSPVV